MRSLSSPLAALLLAAVAGTASAQGAMRVSSSTRATAEVTLTLADSAARAAAKPSQVRIDYGQPHLRGRRLFTDSLLPYDKEWRTGANGATTLTTDVDLVIGGATVPKGKWILRSIPGRSGWKLLVLKDVGASPMPAGMASRPDNEMARIDLRVSELATPLESFSIWLIPSRQPGAPHGELRMSWGTFSVSTDWAMK